MRPVLGYTTLYSQRLIGLKKNIPAYLLQYEAHNISISPRILGENRNYDTWLIKRDEFGGSRSKNSNDGILLI